MMDFIRSLNLQEKLSPRKNSEIIWFYIFLPALVAYFMILTKFINEKPHIGSVDIYEQSLNSLIYGGKQIEVITEGLEWAEGPLWVSDESASLSYLMFSDTIQNRIYKWEEGKGMFTVGRTIYVEDSGCRHSLNKEYCSSMYEPGSNGLLRKDSSSLDLVACQHGERAVTLLRENGTRTEIVTHYKGSRLNSPNDVVWSSDGHMYFTDPTYGLVDKTQRIILPELQELSHSGVYMLRKELVQIALLSGEPSEHVKLLDGSLSKPNGLAFSPDFTKLYVSNSDIDYPVIKAYDVADNGLVSNGTIFFNASKLLNDEIQQCLDLRKNYRQSCGKSDSSQSLSNDNNCKAAYGTEQIDSDSFYITNMSISGEEDETICRTMVGPPDGMKVDIRGNLFASGPGGVLILSPSGKLLGRFHLGGRKVSNVAFGGDGRLYITAGDIVARIWVKTKPNRIISSKL